MSIVDNDIGCPCEGTCCNDPEVGGIEWDCQCDPDDCYCDQNWWLECRNCGACCGCNV